MVSTDKKLLMICYHYPPWYAGWSERSTKFAKYLPKYGWAPVVLTKKANGVGFDGRQEKVIRTPDLDDPLLRLYRRLFHGKESSEHKQEKQKSGIRSTIMPGRRLATRLFELVDKYLMIPDWAVGWAVLALWPSWRFLRDENADAIYTTSPPPSAHLLGLALKNITRKPWVMDFRDPWTFEAVNKHLRYPGFRLCVEKRLERLCFRYADSIIANTPEAEKTYKALYPSYAHKVQALTNGFDGEEMAHAAASLKGPFPWRNFDDSIFVISHVGAFFRYRQEDPTPHVLLNVLKSLLNEQVVSPETCRVIFAGDLPRTTVSRISELGLESFIDTPGVVSHADSLRLMLLSDLLLLFDPHGDGRTYVRSKLYEYLGSSKSILGVVPEGASRQLIKRSGQGLLASPGDAESIRKAIKDAIERRDTLATNPNFDLMSYERKVLTGQLASLLDDLKVRQQSGSVIGGLSEEEDAWCRKVNTQQSET